MSDRQGWHNRLILIFFHLLSYFFPVTASQNMQTISYATTHDIPMLVILEAINSESPDIMRDKEFN